MNSPRGAVIVGLLLAVVSCSQGVEPIAAGLSDRSLLSVAGDAAGTAGRFTISDGASTFVSRHTLPTLTGRYWVTEDGNVYTDFDVDPDLIASEMAVLTERLLGSGGSGGGAPYTEWLDSHYRGSEFQVAFTDLLAWVGASLPIEYTRLFNAMFEARGRRWRIRKPSSRFFALAASLRVKSPRSPWTSGLSASSPDSRTPVTDWRRGTCLWTNWTRFQNSIR